MVTFASNIPASAGDILSGLYRSAAERIAAIALNPTSGTQQGQAFQRGRASGLLSQIDQIVAATGSQAAPYAAGAVLEAVRTGQASAVAQLTSQGISPENIPVRGDLSRIDRRVAAVIAADMAIDLDTALGKQAKAAQRFLRGAAQTIVADSELSKVIAQGAITGDVKGAMRAMRGLLNAAGIEDYRTAGRQIITVGNAQMTVKQYAEMLVRTRTREATVQARSDRLVANGCDLVSIVGRVSQNFCTAYLGRVFSITGTSEEYPALSELSGGGPPFHPNCSKSTAAYVERFASTQQKRQSHVTDDRYLTTDAAEAQLVFDSKDEAALVADRYHTTLAEMAQ